MIQEKPDKLHGCDNQVISSKKNLMKMGSIQKDCDGLKVKRCVPWVIIIFFSHKFQIHLFTSPCRHILIKYKLRKMQVSAKLQA